MSKLMDLMEAWLENHDPELTFTAKDLIFFQDMLNAKYGDRKTITRKYSPIQAQVILEEMKRQKQEEESLMNQQIELDTDEPVVTIDTNSYYYKIKEEQRIKKEEEYLIKSLSGENRLDWDYIKKNQHLINL
jgi:hypothetical protein